MAGEEGVLSYFREVRSETMARDQQWHESIKKTQSQYLAYEVWCPQIVTQYACELHRDLNRCTHRHDIEKT
jgi:hypothetical protein